MPLANLEAMPQKVIPYIISSMTNKYNFDLNKLLLNEL